MQNNGYFHRVHAQTPTRLWINNVTPQEARLALEAGATGCTQNPTYPFKMLTHPQNGAHARALLDDILRSEPDDNAAQAKLQLALVSEVAEVFMPLHERSHGRMGYVTIQADPFAQDADSICAAGKAHCAALPNIMAKVPAIPAGFEAMERLLHEGWPVLATEVMTVTQAMLCARLYARVLDERGAAPVMYFAHIPGIFDEYMTMQAEAQGLEIPSDYVWQGGLAIAKRIVSMLRDGGYTVGLCSGGARGLHHFTEMVGAQACVTINWEGAADALLAENPPVVSRFARPTPDAVVDALCRDLPGFEAAYALDAIVPADFESYGPVRLFASRFEEAWARANALIGERRARMGDRA